MTDSGQKCQFKNNIKIFHYTKGSITISQSISTALTNTIFDKKVNNSHA